MRIMLYTSVIVTSWCFSQWMIIWACLGNFEITNVARTKLPKTKTVYEKTEKLGHHNKQCLNKLDRLCCCCYWFYNIASSLRLLRVFLNHISRLPRYTKPTPYLAVRSSRDDCLLSTPEETSPHGRRRLLQLNTCKLCILQRVIETSQWYRAKDILKQ